MSVTFEEVESGTRITMTQSGFGTGPEWTAHNEATSLGTDEAIRDLILYLETGVKAIRHHSFKSSVGARFTQAPAGVRVSEVEPGGFAASAGMLAGDILVRLAGGPVFTAAEVGFVERAFDADTQLEIEYVRGGELKRGRASLSRSFYLAPRHEAA